MRRAGDEVRFSLLKQNRKPAGMNHARAEAGKNIRTATVKAPDKRKL
jgi:hypothetical protein